MGLHLTRKEIEIECGVSTYARGLKYFRRGMVREVSLTESELCIQVESSVSGSAGRIYQQQVELYDDDNTSNIEGECSCPVGFNCKHIVAALLWALENAIPTLTKKLTGNSVGSWLENLKKADPALHRSSIEQYPDHVRYRLLYVLKPSAIEESLIQLEVVTQKVRILIKGGYGQPSSYPLRQVGAGYYADKFIQQTDQDIARLIAGSKEYYYYDYSNQFALKQEFGALALQKMLLTGRCHWLDKDKPPLYQGAPRTIHFFWEDVDGGKQLVSKIEPPANHLFLLDDFWYIDAVEMVTGPLQHGSLSAEQIALLLKAPLVPTDQLEEVSRRLLVDLPVHELPTPVKIKIEWVSIEDQKPVFVLRLQSLEDIDSISGGRQFHYAQLMFNYAGILLKDQCMQSVVQVIQGDTLYRIIRDSEAEQMAIPVLLNLGLQSIQSSQEVSSLDWLFPSHGAAHSATLWYEFIENEVPRLQKQGWQIDFDESFQLRFEEAEEWHADLDSGESEWFSLALGVDVGGERVNLLPLLVDVLSQAGNAQRLREYLLKQAHFLVPVGDHRWLKLPSERLLPIFDTLVELYDHEPLDEDGNLTFSRYQGAQFGDLLNDPALVWQGAEELQRLNARLRDFEGIQPVDPPRGFNTDLRHYQQQGISWLQFLRDYNFNGILADDMGLGKTVQTLAHLLLEKQDHRMIKPSLVIAPTSLMGNWRREGQRFAPGLKILVLHGSDRHDHFKKIEANDVVLTTYPLLRRDKEYLLEYEFHYIILDEAQIIKNPKSQTTQIVYELKGQHRLCLTGTPLENHLGELWAMFHFLMPGYLGNLERFNRLFRNPIERQADHIRQDQLRRRIKPFLLRRTKAEVAAELPDKTEIIRTVTLEGKQRELYETIRLAMDKRVRQEISKKGLGRSHIMILDALLKLRQVCCDPRLLSLPQAKNIKQSAKLELLMDLLPEMVEEGRKILLFSQFVQMLKLIETELQARSIDYTKLTGQTQKRDQAIATFQDGDVPVFLISLKAGGLGLNLTAADTVIHYDPWWNPAVENQATDRAHRIGQDKAVFVYKLITEETVEEKIIELQQKKQALADSIYTRTSQSKGKSVALTADDLTNLLRPLDN